MRSVAASDRAKTEFMDRTAWIVVVLCVVGLVVWEVYLAKQMAPRPAPVIATPGPNFANRDAGDPRAFAVSACLAGSCAAGR